ncbi:MAG: serine/threonine protein kinase [Deltaproteobacteria bacterium]|nr:serine/threonine protein kinase [Deltaproteobacteria bacterium]
MYLAEMITGDNFKSVVAIKLLHGKWSGHEEIVRRSRDEARVLGLLHHRNIIRVEDLTSINGQCAIVMEYLDGVDLKTLTNTCVERGDRIPRRVVFEVASQIAGALDDAYNKPPLQGGEALRLIHRDIKPSNVMLTVAGDVKVLDFGTAQARFDDREAHTQALAFGSAAYMAPERLLGDPDAPSGDIFSLGITVFEMLSGESFGKIHIRPERFDAKLEKKLEELDLSDLGAAQQAAVRDTLRSVLAYESDRRPAAGLLNDQLEALAEQIQDGSIRRFCREVVAPIRAAMEPQQDENDPLNGSTVFEDSTGLRGEEPNPTWTDDPGAISAGRPRDPTASDARSAGRPAGGHGAVADPADIEVVPLVADPSDIDGPTQMARPTSEAALSASRAFGPGGGLQPPSFTPQGADLFSAPTIVHSGQDFDLEGETQRAPLREPELPRAAEPPPPPPVQQTAIPSSPSTMSESGSFRQKIVASTGPALRPQDSRPPPIQAAPPPIQAAPPPIQVGSGAAGGPPPFQPAPPPIQAAPPPIQAAPAKAPARPGAAPAAPPSSKPAPGKSGSGIGKIIALFAILGLLGAGGAAALFFSGVLDGGATTPEAPVTAGGGGEKPAAGPEGDPGGTIEVGPASEKTGSLTLTLNPPGQASVKLRKAGGFEKVWNGGGKLELVNLPEGSYIVNVTPVGGTGKRDTLDVKPGTSCAFTYQMSSQSWTKGDCK